jgi:hypothetical protein
MIGGVLDRGHPSTGLGQREREQQLPPVAMMWIDGQELWLTILDTSPGRLLLSSLLTMMGRELQGDSDGPVTMTC